MNLRPIKSEIKPNIGINNIKTNMVIVFIARELIAVFPIKV